MADLRVNPSDETIHLGPLAVRFLLPGENSAGSIASFHVMVPARMAEVMLRHGLTPAPAPVPAQT